MTDSTQPCEDCAERPQEKVGLCNRCYKRKRRRALGILPRNDPAIFSTAQRYDGMHLCIRRMRGKASSYACIDCLVRADEWSYSGGCPDERVTDDQPNLPWCPHVTCYEPRCRRCHYAFDKRFLKAARGENRPEAKLTEAKVREVRRRYAEGGTSFSKLAAEHGVELMTMYKAVRGKSWKHVT